MRFSKLLALLVGLSMGVLTMPREASSQKVSANFQLFYDELSPHGMWVDYPHHGYVWMPRGNPGFAPYATDGHWVFTNDGWTWVSDYPWGWATFHYGRWDYDNVYGWYWVPGNEWGPAWVSWRRSPGYYGWAPLRPGISINTTFGKGYHDRNEHWHFVKEGDITKSEVSHHFVNRNENAAIITNSTVITNTRTNSKSNVTYIAGPDQDDVETATHGKVKSVAIRDNDKPGNQLSDDELMIYRPEVQKGKKNGEAPAPSKVTKLSDATPVAGKESKPRPDGHEDKKGKDHK